mmetsp:Transcript_50271/g.150133  ORF Transcript_50271/g.150133 Transcript_50271/m.150133 type:complete len:245 (-) Transcript_50271:865-1599(-)
MANGRGDAMPSSLARSTASGKPSAAAALLVTSSVTHMTRRKSNPKAPRGGRPADWTAAAASCERPEVCTACARPSALPMRMSRCQSTVSRTSLGWTQPPSRQKTESVTATRSMDTPARTVSARPMQKATRGSRSFFETGGGMPAIRVTRRKSALVSLASLGTSTRAMSPAAKRRSPPAAARPPSSRPEVWRWSALELTTSEVVLAEFLLAKKEVSLRAPKLRRSELSCWGDWAVGEELSTLRGV